MSKFGKGGEIEPNDQSDDVLRLRTGDNGNGVIKAGYYSSSRWRTESHQASGRWCIMEIMRHKENAKAVEVTLHLPEHLVEYAKRFGEATQRDVGQVLADTLEMM